MQLTRPETEFLALRGFIGIEIDFVQPDMGRIPVMGILFDGDVLMVLPRAEPKGAVAHERRRARPASRAIVGARAASLHRGRMHRETHVAAEHRDEMRSGSDE